MKRHAIWFILFILTVCAVVSACDPAQREMKELVALQAKRATLIEKLFQQYGGSSLSEEIKNGIQTSTNRNSAQERQVSETAAGVIGNIDRRVFEYYLMQLGAGQQPLLLSSKAQHFFSRPDVRKEASRFYEMTIRINYLEKKLQARAQAP